MMEAAEGGRKGKEKGNEKGQTKGKNKSKEKGQTKGKSDGKEKGKGKGEIQGGQGQRAHQDRRSAFSAYLFQIFGNKHMVLAMIRCPCTCAAQLRHFIADWRKYQDTDEYRKTVRDSCPKTEERAARKEDAHKLRRQLRYAERHGSENVSELQQLVAEADAAYGFNSNTVGKGASRNLLPTG